MTSVTVTVPVPTIPNTFGVGFVTAVYITGAFWMAYHVRDEWDGFTTRKKYGWSLATVIWPVLFVLVLFVEVMRPEGL